MGDDPAARVDTESATRDDKESTGGQERVSVLEAELFPEGRGVSLDEANYAEIVLDRAVREGTEAALRSSEKSADDLSAKAGRRGGAIFRSYLRSIGERLGYLPTWPPDSIYEPGQVGILSDGVFVPVSHINAMGVQIQPRTISSPTHVTVFTPRTP